MNRITIKEAQKALSYLRVETKGVRGYQLHNPIQHDLLKEFITQRESQEKQLDAYQEFFNKFGFYIDKPFVDEGEILISNLKGQMYFYYDNELIEMFKKINDIEVTLNDNNR